MEANRLLQELYSIARRLESAQLFNHAFPFNNTEMQLIKEILRAKETGGRMISSRLAKVLGITRSAVSQMVSKLARQCDIEQRHRRARRRKGGNVCEERARICRRVRRSRGAADGGQGIVPCACGRVKNFAEGMPSAQGVSYIWHRQC